MKNVYFILFFISIYTVNAQNSCDNANSYLVNAYAHAKDSYESNNISHLKYYANRSVEAFQLAKKQLKDCPCSKALEFANKAIEALLKVEQEETFEDGRFFVKRGREFAKQSVIEMDQCAFNNYQETSTQTVETPNNTSTQLSDLQKEQLKLQQQQEALKKQEAEIKSKLAAQKLEAESLKKKQIIASYKKVMSNNVKTYNESLSVCHCQHKAFENTTISEDLSSKSIDEIKHYFTENLKALASDYIAELNQCN
ncbi:hypothetical protein KFZ70_16400 [Tamlana fucoidanivorans]|uniref:DUF4398 domain-containing protein n=1 Tax=Allotamlana fucoidanivorans TaxID=2583814 RepID=A0A5C4SGW3_9FLAO|nr:hypothetical protein [Tamlana fucoidanivorans]TNJ42879.1 hypothetical protein FGF67_12890 [Tamlana fucoidanivorans]